MNVTTHEWQVIGYFGALFFALASYASWGIYTSDRRRRRHAR